jgi:hypothetical protein
MPPADARLERQLAAFTDAVRRALGDELVGLVLHGSAAGDEWLAGRSDVNTLVVVRAVSGAVLERLAALLPRWRRRGFALPAVVDPEFLAHAGVLFPIELDDLRRRHRVLHGADPLAGLTVDAAALRHQCRHEAQAKLLRLRGLFLDAADRPRHLERLLVESVKSFLVILRHWLRLRGDDGAHGYGEVLAAGERLLGPLPALRRVLEHRHGTARIARGALREEFARYLTDVERIVAAVDAPHA